MQMETGKESVCCREIQEYLGVWNYDKVTCMSDHDGFQGLCLNRYVVQTAMYSYLEDTGPLDRNELPHRIYRYLAYRSLTRFIYHKLGRYERRVIPACCVKAIRDKYPSEQYCGFKYARP